MCILAHPLVLLAKSLSFRNFSLGDDLGWIFDKNSDIKDGGIRKEKGDAESD